MKRALLPFAMIVTLAGCASAGYSQQDYNNVVKQAEAEIAVANKLGFTWRDTEKFLKESKKAHAAGDMDKAMKLAKKALRQAQLAQQQAKEQANPRIAFPN